MRGGDLTHQIIFIRHAETNMRGLYCGHANPPVNAAGHRQIQSLLRELSGEHIDAIFTSDLQRAVTTACSIAQEFSIIPVVRVEWRELHFGDWEGLSWDEIERQDIDYAQQWIKCFPDLTAPGGESFWIFRDRVLSELSRVITSTTGRSVAVVTHGGVLRVVLQTICNLSQQEALDATKEYCAWFKYRVAI